MHNRIMNRWHQQLQSLLPSLHAYQLQALAAFSFGLAVAQRCHLSRIAAAVPSMAQPHSTRRRLMRLLDNPRLDVETVCSELAAWLKRWNRPSARLKLLLDETPLRNDLRVLKISVAYRRRALPLLWATYPLKDREEEMPQTVQKLLDKAHQIIHTYAPQASVVLMADRGLCWPSILHQCQQKGWDYVLRAQSQTRFKNGCCHSSSALSRPVKGQLGDFVGERGQWWYGRAQVFQKAGWLECNVVACWPHEAQEAWLLVTNLPPSLQLCRWYSRRNWLEQSFRDEKSHGFNWQESRVRDPKRAHRLLLLMALAHLWLMLLGDVAHTAPWRQRLGLHLRCHRDAWSRFRSGWQLLQYALKNSLYLSYKVTFAPT